MLKPQNLLYLTIILIAWLTIPQTLHEAPPYLNAAEIYARERHKHDGSISPLPVLVISGGRLTCSSDVKGDPIYSRHMFTLSNWGQSLINIAVEMGHRTPIVITTCFHRSPDLIHIRSTLDPDETIATHPSGLANFIRKIIDKEPSGIRLFVYGHSYGGHLALKTVSNLADEVKTEILMTADPISPNDCYLPDSWRTFFSRLQSLEIFYVADFSGCRRFPADVDEIALSRISSSKRWIQTWQKRLLVLHSGENKLADVNLPIEFGVMTINAHDDHAVDRRILDLFKEEWTQNLRSYGSYALRQVIISH